MKIAITGTQNWGPHAEAAEEIVAGFVSKLPKSTILITGGEDDGPGLWANRYAKAYKLRVTEFAPAQVKGAAFNVRNYSQRDKNIAENAERLFCFVYSPAEPEAEMASLMTVIRLQHVGHTTYTFAPDEADETKLKLVDSQNVEAKELLPEKEVKKVGTGKRSTHRKRVRKSQSTKGSSKSTARKSTRPAVRSRSRKPVKAAPTSKQLPNRRTAGKKVNSGTIVLTRHAVVKRDRGTDKGTSKRGAGKTIVLTRI